MGATRPQKIHLITVLIDLLLLAPAPTLFSHNNILSSHQTKLMRSSYTFSLTKFPNKNLMSKNVPICNVSLCYYTARNKVFFFCRKNQLSLFWPVCHSFDVPVKLKPLFLQVIISTSSSQLVLLV